MLKIQNLKAGYNRMEILHGIDFETKPAEIVAIIGPNGAGKSTLLKSIFNLCEIYSGKIIFSARGRSALGGKDTNITNLPTHRLISLGLSYVPQGRQIFSTLTVRENLEMGAYFINSKSEILNPKPRIAEQSSLRGGQIQSSKPEIQKLLEKIYSFFPILKEKEKELAINLSGGQQQMLAIGRALIQDPEILLLDEPSLGLAPKTRKEIFERITEINKEGISIIIVEQNAKQAVEIAHKTYVLEDGKVVLIGGKEILKDERIKDIYFGGREIINAK